MDEDGEDEGDDKGELVVVAQVKQSRRRAGDRAGLNWQEERGPMIMRHYVLARS